MTPAINSATREGIPFKVHTYKHDPKAASYGLEAAEKLNIDPGKVFKTLVVALDTGDLAVGIVPVCGQLDLKSMAQALGVKKAGMADKNAVQRTTGYILGGVSPLGQKKQLATVLDTSAFDFETIFVSAGRRGLDMELKPGDLIRLTQGTMADIARP